MSPEDFIGTYGVTMQAARRDPFPDPAGAYSLVGWDITLTHSHGGTAMTFDSLNYTTDVAVTALSLPHVLQELAGVAHIGGMDYAEACAAAEWDSDTDNRRLWGLWAGQREAMHRWTPDPAMWQSFLSLADEQ